MMKLTYNTGLILSTLAFLGFGTLWGMSTYQWQDNQDGTWMAWGIVVGLFALGLLFLRNLVYNKKDRELLAQYPVIERIVFYLGSLLVGTAVILGCAIPLVNMASYVIQIGLGIFS